MYIFLIIFLIMLVLCLITAGIDSKKQIFYDKKKEKLWFLYPISDRVLMILHHLFPNNSSSVCDELRLLNPGKSTEQLRQENDRRCCASIITVFMAAMLLIIMYIAGNEKALVGNYILRPLAGKGSKDVTLYVNCDQLQGKDKIDISVDENHLAGEKKDEALKKACTFIEHEVLGDNLSAEEIRKPLNLITHIPGTSMKVKWPDIDTHFVFSDGSLNNEKLVDPEIVNMTAEITYFETVIYHTFSLVIYPPRETKMEFSDRLKAAVETEDTRTAENEVLVLPDSFENVSLEWAEKEDNNYLIFLFMGFAATMVIIPGMKQERKRKLVKRKEQMMRDYSEIISKFTILLTAGIPIRAAWERVASDYHKKQQQQPKLIRYAYEELIITCNELNLGVAEVSAYERFGHRCGVASYQRFSTILARNLRRGSRSIIPLLELEANDAFEERKEHVKQLGEKAGTKLLGPMIGIFAIVLAIVIVPAFTSMT